MSLWEEKIKWDNFDILATGRSDIHCKIKETLLIRDLKPAFNETLAVRNLFFTSILYFFPSDSSVCYQLLVLLHFIRYQSIVI